MLLISAHSVSAMNQSQVAVDGELTPEERDCFEWFHKLSAENPSYFKQLSEEDQKTFQQKLRLNDHPDRVRRSRTNAAQAFMAQIMQQGIEARFSEQQVFCVLLKVTKSVHSPK